MNLLTRSCAASVAVFVLSISASLDAANPIALGAVSNARVSFQASGTAGMAIEGVTSDLRVTENDGKIVLTVSLSNLATGIALRDRHMRDKYLEVGKYPVATLTVVRDQLKIPANGESVQSDVQGTLDLHGQSRAVTVHYDAKGDGGALVAHGRFHIDMGDFGISVPSYLGVTVNPPVDVLASFRVAGSGS
jgi:polyisoprenoid-binding protein YceI